MNQTEVQSKPARALSVGRLCGAMKSALPLVLCAALSLGSVPAIIFDTDFGGDIDDCTALAVCHALADNGECEFLAVMLAHAWTSSGPGVDVINTYYSRSDLPIGACHPDLDHAYLKQLMAPNGVRDVLDYLVTKPIGFKDPTIVSAGARRYRFAAARRFSPARGGSRGWSFQLGYRQGDSGPSDTR
jgi:hypothetical protein